MVQEPVAFIAAEAREFSGLRPFLKNLRVENGPCSYLRMAILNNVPVVLAANGAGPVRAAEALEAACQGRPPRAIVSTGFCGGLRPAAKRGSLVCGSEIWVDSGQLVPCAVPALPPSAIVGRIFSVDRVLQTPLEKRDAANRTGAVAVEMEAAGLASRVRQWKVPFFCVRSVTDGPEDELWIDWNAVRGVDGRFRLSRILARAVVRPDRGGPELWRLWSASRSAAQTLGEYLADCRF